MVNDFAKLQGGASLSETMHLIEFLANNAVLEPLDWTYVTNVPGQE